MIKTELLPAKFKGDKTDTNTVGIWCKRFKTAISLCKIEPKEAVNLFKLWTEGEAAIWQQEQEESVEAESWTLDDWLKKLNINYSSKTGESNGSVFELAKIKKIDKENMADYNRRFRKYLATIDKKMYTDELIRKIYIDNLAEIDRDLWWKYAQNARPIDLNKIMANISELMDIKDQVENPAEIAKNTSQSDTAQLEFDKRMYELTAEMKKLALLTQKNGLIEKRDFSNVVCFNCQKKGHTSKVCKLPRGGSQEENKSAPVLLAIKKKNKPNIVSKIMPAKGNKRPRLENLLNPVSSMYELRNNNLQNVEPPRLGKVHKKKKKITQQKQEPNPEWTKRVLDSQAPISVREVLSLKPKLIKDLVRSLNSMGRTKRKPLLYAENLESAESSDSNNSESSDDSEEEEDDALSYLATYINKQPVPLFLDPGASYSIIDISLVKKLGLDITKLKIPVKIKSVNGEITE
ncbi:hypothetical protein AYI69_g5764, partial [Smittium culicis]